MRDALFLLTNFFNRFTLFRSRRFSFQELIYYYALGITFLLAFISLFTNLIIQLPLFLVIYTLASLPFLGLLFWLAFYKKLIRFSQSIYLIFVFISFNIIWFSTEGSAGGAIIIIQAFLLLFLFFSTNRQIYWILPILFLNILMLFGFEWLFPESIEPYETPLFRSIDMFVVVSIFFLFEIPVILYAKRSIEKERNQAVASEAQKTSYMVNLSHEIRTPMNAILGFSELMEDDEIDAESRKHYLRIVNQNGRMLLNLLNNVINISRLDSQETKVSLSTFSPDEILKQVCEVLNQQMVKDDQVELNLVLPNEVHSIESDATMLYQIVINLGYNAIKFTDAGYVHVGYFPVDDNLVFYVKDTGKGIPKTSVNNIFKRFKQSNSTNVKNNPHGAGLGLTICKGLTDLLKGEIWLESAEGVGTTFYFKLPKKYS